MMMTILMMKMMMMVVKCSIVSWASADSIPGKLPWVNKQKQPPQAFYKFGQKLHIFAHMIHLLLTI